MKSRTLFPLFAFLPLIAAAQLNTNLLLLTGAGDTNANGSYVWTNNEYLSTNNYAATNWYPPLHEWIIGDEYWTTNFPTNWFANSAAPAPSGAFAFTPIVPSLTGWSTITTNYWTRPGDYVTFAGSGRNQSIPGVTSNQLVVSIDGNPVFTGPWSSGAGYAWQISGRVSWDGTNFNCSGTMQTGDSSTPSGQDIEQFTNVVVGTNTWLWTVNGDTNGLTFINAGVLAARAPTNDAPSHSIAPALISGGGGGGGSVTLPTNLVYSVLPYQTFATNRAYWSSSNFLARVPGLYSWTAVGGDDGGANVNGLPTGYPVSLVGSYSGTSGWFPITNGFATSNEISVSMLVGTNAYGTPQVDPGMAALYTLNDWSHYGQNGLVVQLAAMATTTYVDTAVANVSPAFPSYSSNGVTHTVYTVAGQPIFDTAILLTWGQIIWTGQDVTGTNFLIEIMATNLVGGFTLQSSTNLAQIYNWQPWTNFTMTSVSGTNTLTVPEQLSCQFFRVIKNTSSTLTVFPPLAVAGGIIYPTNVWNLNAITNALPPGAIWQGWSNGPSLVTLTVSNGVVRYLQWLH